MKTVIEFIQSGILEMYVLGETNTEETLEVERMSVQYPEVRHEIDAISQALEQYALEHAIEPDPTVKPFLFATMSYMERLQAGEIPAAPPILHEGSKISDYNEWLNRPDLGLTLPLNEFFAHIIGHTSEALTAIVWIESGAPQETHTDEYERFLIVEGTCDITIGTEVHHMSPGSFLTIPLHISHHVVITSQIPCKIILQRVAA